MSHPSCYDNKASAANCLLYNNAFEHPTQIDATIYPLLWQNLHNRVCHGSLCLNSDLCQFPSCRLILLSSFQPMYNAPLVYPFV